MTLSSTKFTLQNCSIESTNVKTKQTRKQRKNFRTFDLVLSHFHSWPWLQAVHGPHTGLPIAPSHCVVCFQGTHVFVLSHAVFPYDCLLTSAFPYVCLSLHLLELKWQLVLQSPTQKPAYLNPPAVTITCFLREEALPCLSRRITFSRQEFICTFNSSTLEQIRASKCIDASPVVWSQLAGVL